ncbi:hypothetical protein ONS95_013169 [Cadophora gregata]|uniref:uncharacterized protein n=1 Tax=Cadophora gregata TaxID=51156 RepID=UPI0026DC6E63|nr:uncharacterized protein ONS95_013169 [Cadophora gregata]KAK0100014.1 hypothetical protein ONS96_007956 [Cadophora gregata f. sp. sojae]KAK0116138.1 hypothetical protein ONS95_013169 [Cadophora gregata]
MALSRCVICDKPNVKECAACRSSAYCSPACQQVDWPLHKTLCKKLSILLKAPRPKFPVRLGILLSADDPNPQFVWYTPAARSPNH